jgi:hypothetical protein
MTTTVASTPPETFAEYPAVIGYPRVGKPRIVTVSVRRCFAIEGTGTPGGAEFQEAMGALHGAAYSLHFLLRNRGIDSHTGPSEALWERRDGVTDWSEGEVAFRPTAWRWTLLLPVPVEAEPADIATALADARLRRTTQALDRLRVIELDEGVVVEAMHVGPYDAEPDTIARMHEVANAEGLAPAGPHHEIYLGVPGRTAPERLRTVLRQPVKRAA